MNNYKEAKKYFHLCSYFNSLLFHNNIAALDINNTLAMIFFEEKNFDSALYFATVIPWDNDLSKVDKGRMSQFKDRIYILTKIYVAIGDKKNAGEYFEKYTVCRDSIDQQINEDYRAEAETKLNIAEKDRALKSMATENELQKVKAQKNRNANLFLISFLILGAIVITVLLRTYVIQKKSNALKEQLLGQKELLLGQKDILMKEIHHRVKNNLQVISTLLDLQLDNIKDVGARKAITEGMSRIRSISLIHQQLYQHDDMTSIEFSKFAKDLLHQVTAAFKKPGQNVALQNEIPEIFLDIDTAVPLGLMLNELMTNSYKYAFGDSPDGSIHIKLENKTDHYELIYGDSGPGMPPDFELAASTSLGIMVIDSLSKQLGGRMDYDDRNKQFVIQFKDIAGRKKTA